MQDTSNTIKRAQAKAKTLIEALPYVQRFAGETMVIKFGGHAMKSREIQTSFARDVTLLRSVGVNVVIVHGGGPQVSSMLKQLNLTSEFVEGMRVTTQDTMEVAQMVLIGQVNTTIVQLINSVGGDAIGLSGVDGNLLRAQRMRPNGHDIGRVGEVIRVDDNKLRLLSESGVIPVIAPIGIDVESNETLNINADYVAGAIAEHLLACKLILMTDVDALRGPDGEDRSSLTVSQAHEWIESGVIEGGMIPKVRCACDALYSGVEKVHILNGSVEHSILLEVFTDEGVGTQLVSDE